MVMKNEIAKILSTNIEEILQMSSWSDKDKKILVSKKIIEIITNLTVAEILRVLTKEEGQEMLNMTDGNEIELQNWLKNKVPNYKEIAAGQAALVQMKLKDDLNFYQDIEEIK